MATTPIKLKRSHTISVIPDTSDLIAGEVALNTVDKKFYVRDGSSQVITLANHYATDFDVNVVTFKVTVATSSSAHSYHGTGSSNKYKINGVFSPYLKLIPRITYRFDQSDSSNSTHPLLFYYDSGKTTAYTTGVTTNGTPGSAGAYTQIIISDTTPPVLHYQCSAHANMGWAVTTSTRNLTGFDTDDLSEGSSNLYYTDARVGTYISGNRTYGNITSTGNISGSGNLTLTSTDAGSSAAPEFSLVRDSSSPADADYLGQIKFLGDDDGGSQHTYAKITGKIQDASAGTEDGIIEFANVKAGSNTITARLKSDKLELVNGTNLEVAGNATITGNLTVNGGQIISEDGFVGFGDSSGDNWGKIEYIASDPTGFDAQYNNAISFDNEQGGTNQQLYLLDTQAGNDADLFGLAAGGAAILSITGQGDIKFKRPNNNTTYDITLATPTPTANRTITLPDATGTIALTSDISSSDVSDDSSPQLGGNLDVNGNSIVSASNGNISITPNGSGSVIIDGLSHPQADGNAGQVLKTDGSGQLAFASVSSLAGAGIQNLSDDSSPQLGGNLDVVTHSIVSTSNRDINLTPNGSGKVVVGTNGIEFGDGSIQTSAGATTGFSIAMATALG